MTSAPSQQQEHTQDDRRRDAPLIEEDNGSFMESSGNSDGSEGTMTLLYHGSCSECHHYHRHVPFDIPTDDTKHTRFHCQECQHPIFGLGRRETQITLASQDSFPVMGGQVTAPAEGACSNYNQAIPSLRLDTSAQTSRQHRQDPLSAITEQPSPAAQNHSPSQEPTQISNTPISGPRLLDQQHNPPRNTTSAQISQSQSMYGGGGFYSRTPSLLRRFIYRLVGRLARRIGRGPREFRLLGLRLCLEVTSEYLDSQHTPAFRAEHLSMARDDIPPVITDQAHEPAILESGPFELNIPVGRQSPPSSPSRPQKQASLPSRYSERPSLVTGQISKDDKLHNYRRDKTLRKEALRGMCDCTDGCPCRNHARRPLPYNKESTSEGSTSSHGGEFSSEQVNTRSNIHHPQALGSINPLVNVGSRFVGCDNRLAGHSTSAANNRQRRFRTPITESVMSSISLSSGRPLLSRRSRSASDAQSIPVSDQIHQVDDFLENFHTSRQTQAHSSLSNVLSWRNNEDVPGAVQPHQLPNVSGHIHQLPLDLNLSVGLESNEALHNGLRSEEGVVSSRSGAIL